MKSLGENISLRKLLEAFTLPSPGEAGNASFLSPYVCHLESGSSGLEMTDSWKIQRPEEAKAIHLRGWNKEDRIENKSTEGIKRHAFSHGPTVGHMGRLDLGPS